MSQIIQLSHPEWSPKPDFNNSRGGFGGHAQRGVEPSEPSNPKFTQFPGDLEALHSEGLSHPQTNHVLRRVSPFWGAYLRLAVLTPCETRFLTIHPPVMQRGLT